MNKVYFTFKSYVEDSGIETEDLLKEMLRYARYYQTLLRGKTNDKALNACIDRLNRLETTVTRPFFMEVLRMQEEGTLGLEQVREIFLMTENYLFRRSICDLPTNVLNKIRFSFCFTGRSFVMTVRERIMFQSWAMPCFRRRIVPACLTTLSLWRHFLQKPCIQ